MEYTDAPAVETPLATPAVSSLNPAIDGRVETVEGKASDFVAVLLSIIPGLGHIYKGHRLMGLVLMFVGTPFAVLGALLLATGTAGFGIMILPVYWICVMVHVYAIPDRVSPSEIDEGEQY